MSRTGVRLGRDVVNRALVVTSVCSAALLGVAGIMAQTQSPPVDCVTACRVNRATAPPTCDCVALTAGDRTSERVVSLDDLDPVEELRKLFDAETRRMAAVENYLVVETLNIAPMPSIQYWQRESTPDGSVFRLVPPHELAQLDAKAQAEKAGTADGKAAADLMGDPTAFLDVLAQGLRAAGGGSGSGAGSTGGLLGQLAGALNQVGADVKAQDAQDQQELQKDGPHPLLEMAFNKYFLELDFSGKGDPVYDRLRQGLGWYFPDRPTPRQRFVRRTETRLERDSGGRHFCSTPERVRSLKDGDKTCTTVPDGAFVTWWGSFASPIDLEFQGSEYTVERAEFWTTCEGEVTGKSPTSGTHCGPPVRLLSRIEGYQTTIGGFRRFVIEHETDQFRQAGPALMPHRTRQRVETDDTPRPEVVKTIRKIRVNEGPPTQAELAAILAEAGKPAIKAPEAR